LPEADSGASAMLGFVGAVSKSAPSPRSRLYPRGRELSFPKRLGLAAGLLTWPSFDDAEDARWFALAVNEIAGGVIRVGDLWVASVLRS